MMFVLVVSVIAIAALVASLSSARTTDPVALILAAPALAAASAALAAARDVRVGPRQRHAPARPVVRARPSTILLSRLRA